MRRQPAIAVRPENWLPVTVILAGLAAWELAAHTGWISVIFFPAPSQIASTLLQMVGTTTFWWTLGATLFRLMAGLFLGGSAGLLLGWAMGTSRPLRTALDPIVAALHPLPKLAIFPIFLVLLGIGEASKVALVALTAFFPMVINTLAGVRQIDANYWEAAANYGASGWALARRVILPGSLPMVMVGLRLAVNSAWVVTIAVEMLSAQDGLGARIWLVWQTLRLSELYAVLFIIALLGWGLHVLLITATTHLAPWHNERPF